MSRRLLVLPLLLFLLASCAAPQAAPPTTRPTEPAPVIGEPQIPPSEIPRVTLEDAKAAFDGGSAVFVDVRSLSSWQESHIAGALSIPVNEMETRLSELDPDQWIITYCTWMNEESSARAAQILKSRGFSRVTPILGGFHAWVTAGYPVESGKWIMESPRHLPWPESVPPTQAGLERSLLSEGLDFYSWSNAPFDVYAPHSHNYDKVLYCVRGSITFQLMELGTWYKLLPGDRLELPAGTMHAAEVGEEGVVCLESHA